MTEVISEATASLEEIFLIVFCHVDDLYKETVPHAVRERSQHERIACSDSEIITLSLMQEALSMDAEESFLRFVRKNYLHLFPHLVSHDRYNRRRRAPTEVHLLLFRHWVRRFGEQARWLIFDSAPVETAQFVRSQSAQVSMPKASYGFIPAKKRSYGASAVISSIQGCAERPL